MRPEKKWTKTLVVLFIGMLLGIVLQNLGDRWSRPAEATSINDVARTALGTMGSLLQAIPIPKGEKIEGVAGLGDGETFIVYTDEMIRFYRFVNPYRVPSN